MTGQVFGSVAEGSTTQQTEAETSKASFSLRGHNPDVLTCIANLSSDEVFTPPELANEMLDVLEEAWAESNAGANIWADPSVTFLDPFTKSGVFLREIVTRLTKGLEHEFPDLQQRVDHILTKQVFGIGITQLTALLARRTVYCSKFANGKHSITDQFDDEAGNIWFERTEHTWTKRKREQRVHPTSGITEMVELEGTGRCKFCGAQEAAFHRDAQLETHAYAFIHTDDINARLAELFGANMQFDVIIGNPPYQMTGASGGSSDASIYHLFVEQAQRMQPRFVSMVIPSRWMAGGRGLGEFRKTMLSSKKISNLTDYPVSRDVFPGVEVKGGICHFLWDDNYNGSSKVTLNRGDVSVTADRILDEFDVFVREPIATNILRKVLSFQEPSITSILTRDTPFGLATNFADYRQEPGPGRIPLYRTHKGKRSIAFVSQADIKKNINLIDRWKLLIPEAGSDGGQRIPDLVLGKPWVAPPPSVCTQSFLVMHFTAAAEARSAASYYASKFLRFLVSLRKITQHALFSTYQWVPLQAWNRTWTDEELYDKYGLTNEEIAFIESQIKPMELSDE